MREVAQQVRDWLRDGRRVIAGRVIGIEGFSTWPGDELVAFDENGRQAGTVLGAAGSARIGEEAARLRDSGANLGVISVEIQGKAAVEAGLSCGGRAEVLLQASETIPGRLWDALAERAPVAMVTRLDRDSTSRVLEPGATEEAAAILVEGRSKVERSGETVVEAWVPAPRIVLIGAGELATAISAQAGLLGWETAVADDAEGALDWAGASAALVVLSHDPHIDVPALHAGIRRKVPYVGALGSRNTQSRRLEQLRSHGLTDAETDSIRRPIGLDLGGRSAAEVALSICAEILAVRFGRHGGPLRDRGGPIH
jgi:xanthine dehydrogenase accessory factor